MAIKNANVTARVEQDVKDQAETILNSLGVSVSSFINMDSIFYYNSVRAKDTGSPYKE